MRIRLISFDELTDRRTLPSRLRTSRPAASSHGFETQGPSNLGVHDVPMTEPPMSAFEPIPPPPDSVTICHTAHFSTQTLHPEIVAISALGELDAANAQDFIAYALLHATGAQRLVLDLSSVEFFGTAAFSALHTL